MNFFIHLGLREARLLSFLVDMGNYGFHNNDSRIHNHTEINGS